MEGNNNAASVSCLTFTTDRHFIRIRDILHTIVITKNKILNSKNFKYFLA